MTSAFNILIKKTLIISLLHYNTNMLLPWISPEKPSAVWILNGTMSMVGLIYWWKPTSKYFKKLLHTPSHRAQHAPHEWTTPTYGQARQYATPPNTTKKLDKKGQKHVQRVVNKIKFVFNHKYQYVLYSIYRFFVDAGYGTGKQYQKLKNICRR